MSKINLKQNIKLQVRIQVLYDVIENLALSFGFPTSIEKILHKGIVQKQILSSVYAYYINDKGYAVGKVSFDIDWEKHNVYASTDSGKNIYINSDVPIIEQFASWSQDLINYVEMMQKSLNVSKIKVFFRYRDEIRNDKTKDKEADEFLGLSKSSYKAKFDEKQKCEFERAMSFTSEMLPELEIKINSNT